MSELKICRICLRTKAKMYKFNRHEPEHELKCYYEEVMALKVNEHDGLPQCFCYECAAMLHKFHKFKKKCCRGQKALKEILWRGPITYDAVCKVDRDSQNLRSPLEIMTCNKNVRTYIFKHETLNKLIKKSCSIKNKRNLFTFVEHESAVENNTNFPILSAILNTSNLLNDPFSDIENEKICNSDNTPINFPTVLMELDDEKSLDIKQISSSPKLAGAKEDGLNMSLDVEDIPTNLTTVFVADSDQNMSFNEQISTVISDDDTNHIPSDIEEIPAKPIVLFEDDNNPTVNLNIGNKNNNIPITMNSTNIFVEELTLDEKQIKEKQSEEGRFQGNKKKRFLDMKHWEKYSLNEEEAWQEFRTRAEHRTYMRAHYSCKDCLKGFSQEDMLKRHLQRKHHESAGRIHCRFCHVRFKRMHELRRHLEEHLIKYKCLRCNLVCRMETSALFHEDYHNGVIRKCKHCGKEFRHLSTYYTHLRTHRSEHVCNLCGVSFVSEAGLHLHKLVKHIGAEPAKEGIMVETDAQTYCERCNIKFETKAAYEEHLFHSAMHSKGVEDLAEDISVPARPIACRKAMRTLRKPTECSYCGEVFPTQSACMKHHQLEHPRKPFCPNEERSICEICGIPLKVGNVAKHMNTHTLAQVFTCDTCGVKFNSKSSMQRHQLTHTGEKPYPCTLCDKRFTQSNSVKLHYRTFHLKQPYPKRNRRKKTDEDTVIFV